MNRAFGWAFIGAGTLGAKVAKQITKSGRHRIAAVYVRNAEKRAAFAADYKVYSASSAKDAITAPGVDGVYIVTPHPSHYEYAKLALELGKPVLCEKPVTLERFGGEKENFQGDGGMLNEFDLVSQEIREGLTQSRFVPHEATLGVMEIMDECRRQLGLVYPFEMEVDRETNYIRTISHLGFNCADLEKSIAFYRDILGCREKFTLTWDDLAQDIRKKALEKGEKLPFYVKEMEKRLKGKKWSVYMSWTDNTFIELFYVPSAHRKHPADSKNDLNYTHFSLEVCDLKAFREQVLARGGAPYIDSEIELGLENTWVFWMHDPDGNKFEIMEYTKDSYQVVGR